MARKQKYDYFKAFENQVDVALQEADLLIDVIDNFTTAEAVRAIIPRAHELEHQGDQINHETYMAIAVDFITPIDRDDILKLAQALDNITDSIEDVIHMFYTMDVHFMHHDTKSTALLVRSSCEALKRAMCDFKNFKKSETFKQSLIDVNTYEEQADELYEQMTRKLYTVDADNPLRVIVWSRIFGMIEQCNDACETAADLMSTIVLKNS